ncbi:hypothetical protein L226DRAFT_526256 [Lentinus tigrinus ALCF2SS1-7]|uniref:uncharacterized protein n=1 Tax=Lentinus tigrinus ALCF2SS1-7 TaxID=1328758 RepID=UPI001165FC91|nr:hypothetical protein L226DRAFT_526256 [Lentinus tigrinus ALCF2SS1-7]
MIKRLGKDRRSQMWTRKHVMQIAPAAGRGLLAFGLVRIETPVLTGWQFLFLAIAEALLNRHHRPQSHGDMTVWQGFKAIVNDVHAWLPMIVYASFNVGVATISYFLSTLGFTPLASQGLAVVPYAAGWFMVVFQALHSDRTRDRGYHIILSTAISCMGYIVLAALATRGNSANTIGGRYFALFLVVGGNYSLFPLVMSWAANGHADVEARRRDDVHRVDHELRVDIYFDAEDNFQKGHSIAAGCLFASFLAAFLLRARLACTNRRNTEIVRAMSESERDETLHSAADEREECASRCDHQHDPVPVKRPRDCRNDELRQDNQHAGPDATVAHRRACTFFDYPPVPPSHHPSDTTHIEISMRLRRLLGLVNDDERAFTDEYASEDGEEGEATLERRNRSSFTSDDDDSTSEADKSQPEDDASTSSTLDDAPTSNGDGSMSEDANLVPGSTWVVELFRVVHVGTASYCYTSPFWRGADLSRITSPEKLQWCYLWPSDTYPTDVTFLIDRNSREYRLYQSALHVLRREFPQPFPDDAHYGTVLKEQTGYVSPMKKHESWGVLVNLLGDRYCMHLPTEDITAEIRETLSMSSTLDFIVSGLFHMFSLTRHYRTSDPPTALAALRRHYPSHHFKRFVYEAIFFDLMYGLWKSECLMRRATQESPMPWSETSMQESSESRPTSSGPLYSPLLPSFTMPSVEAWEAWDAEDALNRRWAQMENLSCTYGFPPDIPWFGAPHDGYPLASTISSYVRYRRCGSAYGHGLKEDFALWLSAQTFGVLEIITGIHIPEASLLVHTGGSQVLSGTRLLWFMCLSTHKSAVNPDHAVVEHATGNMAKALRQALMALVEEGTSMSSLILRSLADIVHQPVIG